MSIFTRVPFDWSELTEEDRYEVWSEHLNAGGEDISYPAFCDTMDLMHS